MRLQKCTALLLFFLYICLHQSSLAKNNLQDSIPKFNKEAFQASLQELPPKEFARLFTQQYTQDSVKTVMSMEYVKNSMIASENLEVQFWGYNCLAYWQNNIMDHEESIISLNKALSIAKSLNNDNLIMTSLQDRGNNYFDFGEYEKAMRDYLEILDLAKKTKNKVREQVITLAIALIKMQTNDYPGALELLNGILKVIKDEEPETFHIDVYIALTKGYIGVENYNQAKLYCEKGLNLSELLNDEEAKFYFFSFLGRISYLNENFEEAHDLIDKSLRIAESTRTLDHEIPVVYVEKGEVFYGEKKYDDAIKILLEAEVLMKKNKLAFFQLEKTYALLAKSYKEINDIDNSLKYYEKANEVYKKNDKRQGEISANIAKKYDLAELKEELDKSQEKSKNKSKWLSISISSTIILVVSFGIIYGNREKQNLKKFQKLLATQDSLNDEAVNTEPNEVLSEKEKNYISDAVAEEILVKLKIFEDKKLYLHKNVILSDAASKMGTNPTYLSKTVNKFKKKSFSNYIKDLRINYAIEQLKSDKKFRLYTIEAIAKEVGYNHSKSFSKAFKSKTGLYPSYFIKQLNNKLTH